MSIQEFLKNKNFSIFFLILVSVVFIAAIVIFSQPPPFEKPLASEEISVPSNVSEIRLENEAKIVVPKEILEDVWTYLRTRICDDKTFIKNIDPALDSYWDDEMFYDTYFDTPDLAMARRNSGIRHRTRENLTDPSDKKNDRELLQIKFSNINGNVYTRGEIKYDIKVNVKKSDPESMLPVLGLISAKDRQKFKEVLGEINIDPYKLREILELTQRRRSIFITYNGKAFISERLDEVSSDMLWAAFRHTELEPELNEVPYTEAGNARREFMQKVNNILIKDVMQQFPSVKMDLTPKYNKALNYFINKIPALRFLIYNNLL